MNSYFLYSLFNLPFLIEFFTFDYKNSPNQNLFSLDQFHHNALKKKKWSKLVDLKISIKNLNYHNQNNNEVNAITS